MDGLTSIGSDAPYANPLRFSPDIESAEPDEADTIFAHRPLGNHPPHAEPAGIADLPA